jgi:hypothetical protein
MFLQIGRSSTGSRTTGRQGKRGSRWKKAEVISGGLIRVARRHAAVARRSIGATL